MVNGSICNDATEEITRVMLEQNFAKMVTRMNRRNILQSNVKPEDTFNVRGCLGDA